MVCKKEKTFVNDGEQNQSGNNIESLVTGNKYLMNVYYRTFELSKNVVLVEKAELVSGEEVLIQSSLSNNELAGYKVAYELYDAVSKEFICFKENVFVKPFETSLGADYFAVLVYQVTGEKV